MILPERKMAGVHIYCNSTECLKQAVKKKSLERSLKTPIPKDIYQELEKEMIKGES